MAKSDSKKSKQTPKGNGESHADLNGTSSVSKPTKAKKESKHSTNKLQRFASSFYAVPLDRPRALGGSGMIRKFLFVKEKVASIEEQMTAATIDKSLIVVNISVDDTEHTLRALFAKLILGVSPTSDAASEQRIKVDIGKDRLALVKFVDMEEDLEPKLRALTQEECLRISRELSENVPAENAPTCIERWLQEYKQNRPDRASIGRAADERMQELEDEEREERERNSAPIVDDDGFTLVVGKKGKPAPPPTKKAKLLQQPPAITEPKKKKGRIMDEKLSFYKFERRRVRTQEMSRLKDKFKNDRKRAMRLKQELSSGVLADSA